MIKNSGIKEQLCFFTRYPEPGTTKTRLIGVLGKEGAADLQRRMTVHVLGQVRPLVAQRSVHVTIFYEGGDEKRMARWLGTDLSYAPQESGDIGRRMAYALNQAAASGFESAILIGADIPGITTDILYLAFERLCENDLVFGPAEDGGYYLIGLQLKHIDSIVPGLFTNIRWSTPTVLAETIERVESLNLNYALLYRLGDVDEPADIARWEAVLETKSGH